MAVAISSIDFVIDGWCFDGLLLAFGHLICSCCVFLYQRRADRELTQLKDKIEEAEQSLADIKPRYTAQYEREEKAKQEYVQQLPIYITKLISCLSC